MLPLDIEVTQRLHILFFYLKKKNLVIFFAEFQNLCCTLTWQLLVSENYMIFLSLPTLDSWHNCSLACLFLCLSVSCFFGEKSIPLSVTMEHLQQVAPGRSVLATLQMWNMKITVMIELWLELVKQIFYFSLSPLYSLIIPLIALKK